MNYLKFKEYNKYFSIYYNGMGYKDPWRDYVFQKRLNLETEFDRRLNCVCCEMESKLFKTYVNNAHPGIVACDLDFNDYVPYKPKTKIVIQKTKTTMQDITDHVNNYIKNRGI